MIPVVAVVALAATWGSKPPALFLVVVGALLAGAVLAAVGAVASARLLGLGRAAGAGEAAPQPA